MNKLMHKLGEKTAKAAKNVGKKSVNQACWVFWKQPELPKELEQYKKR